MAATTRWVEYSVAAATSKYLGATTSGVGTRGSVKANSTVGDNFTIGPTNNNLQISVDSGSYYTITLTSGVNLDARFVAKDITEKMHTLQPTIDSWAHATCEWVNNGIIAYSGNVGAASAITVASGVNTAYDTLGFTSKSDVVGTGNSYKASNLYNGSITASGTWEGMFDETYTIIINKETTIGSPSPGGGNGYTGTVTAGGQYNHGTADPTYTITIDGTAGLTVGGGTTHVPKFSWTSTGSPADNGGPIEILYSDHWYNVGTRGLKVKWEDKVFGDGDTWTIACTKPVQAVNGSSDALPGTAQYIWTSNRGDECTSPIVTSDTAMTRVGTRGLYMQFGGGSTNLEAGDEFRVVCTPPQPSNYNITSLNYGNVTVTTESPVKAVLFEIMSGAVMMTSVKFGLQNHGSFSYHEGGGDTYFRYGTIGGKNTAGPGQTTNKEWRTGVTAEDLSGTLPAYLFANKANLSVVATADDSEPIGNYQGGLVSDFVYLCIRLGADETGSNSSVNYRLYFDYS